MQCRLCNKKVMVNEGEPFEVYLDYPIHIDCLRYLKTKYNKPIEELCVSKVQLEWDGEPLLRREEKLPVWKCGNETVL